LPLLTRLPLVQNTVSHESVLLLALRPTISSWLATRVWSIRFRVLHREYSTGGFWIFRIRIGKSLYHFRTFRNATFFLDATLLTFYIVGGRMNTRHSCAGSRVVVEKLLQTSAAGRTRGLATKHWLVCTRSRENRMIPVGCFSCFTGNVLV
jgi:hypothetical protein